MPKRKTVLKEVAKNFDPQASEAIAKPINPFDPAALRMSQDFVESAGVRKLITTVPVRKPHKHDLIRVRRDPEFANEMGLLQLGDDKEFYVVSSQYPDVIVELSGEFNIYRVYTTINQHGTVCLWPIRLPGSDGKQNSWWESGHKAACIAMGADPQVGNKWVRVRSNQNLRAYEVFVAENSDQIPPPVWPDLTMSQLDCV
jgi:hypothetical protein